MKEDLISFYNILDKDYLWSDSNYIPEDEEAIFLLSKTYEDTIFQELFYDFIMFYQNQKTNKPELEKYLRRIK